MYRQVDKFQLRTVRGIACVDALANSKEEAENAGYHYMFSAAAEMYGKTLDNLGHKHVFCMVADEEYLQHLIEKNRVEPPYRIWQLKMDIPEARDIMFMRYDKIKDKFCSNNYEVIYEAAYHNESLEKIFVRFNTQIPSGYRGHSLSVSDVVEINGNFYYVDSVGFVNVTEKWKK